MAEDTLETKVDKEIARGNVAFITDNLARGIEYRDEGESCKFGYDHTTGEIKHIGDAPNSNEEDELSRGIIYFDKDGRMTEYDVQKKNPIVTEVMSKTAHLYNQNIRR